MKNLSLSLFIFLLFPASLTLAENPYLSMKSLGEQKVEAVTGNQDSDLRRPISSWIGESFIFLPKQKTLQRFGYQNFRIGDDPYKCPRYDEYVGRIAKVVSAQQVNNHWDVEFEMEDNGQRVSATAISGAIDGIAPVADIDTARDRWLGKNLWYKKTWIETYSDDTGETHSIHVKKNCRVKIIDIIVGWRNATPVRFILQTPAGQKGYVDVGWSGTNCSEYERDYSDSFKASFFTQDPTKSGKSAKKS